MYDADGNYVGAEGPTFSGNYDAFGAELDQWGNPIDQGVPWQNTFLAPLGNKLGWNWAGYDPGQGQDMGSRTWAGGVTDDDIDAMMMADADMGGVRPTTPGTDFFGGDVRAPVVSGAYGGFLGDRMGAPPAGNTISGLLEVDDFADSGGIQPQVNPFQAYTEMDLGIPSWADMIDMGTGVDTFRDNTFAQPAGTGLLGDYGTMATEEDDYRNTQEEVRQFEHNQRLQEEQNRQDALRLGLGPYQGNLNVSRLQEDARIAADEQRNQQKAAAAQVQAQAQAAEAKRAADAVAFRRDEARLSNLLGRDRGVNPTEVAALQARINAYAPRTAGGRMSDQARAEAELGRANLGYAEETGLGRGWSVG